MEFLQIKSESEDMSYYERTFAEIARKLFNEYAIQTFDSLYRITEIEFYWDSTNHKDKSTYQRNHVDPKSGEWFFHYSGVDIALKSENNNGYGGILLRSIYDINKKELYKGPLVSVMKLFSGTNAFNGLIQTKIITHQFSPDEILQTERIGLGDNAKQNGADKLRYRFLIDIKPYKKNTAIAAPLFLKRTAKNIAKVIYAVV